MHKLPESKASYQPQIFIQDAGLAVKLHPNNLNIILILILTISINIIKNDIIKYNHIIRIFIINNEHHLPRPYKILPHQSQPTLLDRHVRWLKKERGAWGTAAVVALGVFEAIALTATGIGTLALYQGIKKIKKIDHERAFIKHVETVAKPDEAKEITFKSKTQAFNHTHEFILENDTIWFRGRNQEEPWTAMYFDGFSSGYKPVFITCDGANLVVLDQHNQVHYKKVLREFRNSEVANDSRVQQALDGQAIPDYICIDKTAKNNWKDKWFSLPFLHVIGNLFTGKLLKLPKDMRAWTISQRGRYNNYIEDAEKQQHKVGAGVTTLYVLDKKGKDIFKYDPWSPKNATMNVYLPESSQTSFEALNLDASASTLMAIGYESKRGSSEKTLKVITRLVDIDSEGWNPGLKYSYFKNENDPDVRVVPMPKWKEHPLIMDDQSPIKTISGHITITQIGEGNDARELRIAGSKNGKNGHYFKHLTEDYWHFEKTNDSPYDKALPLKADVDPAVFNTTVNNYNLKKAKFYHSSEEVSGRIEHFGMRSFDSIVHLKIGRQDFEFHLYKKKTLENFFGLNKNTYELVLPNNLPEDKKAILEKIFKKKKVIPVQVQEDRGNLRIKSSYFKWDFN